VSPDLVKNYQKEKDNIYFYPTYLYKKAYKVFIFIKKNVKTICKQKYRLFM